MEVSIITAVFNSSKTIEDCMKSIHFQTYPHIEHIIIDGGSTDGTLNIIEKYRDKIAKLVSEPDRGIYDAMNKGINLATGDIIGILNSDDVFADKNTVSRAVSAIVDQNVDSCYADIIFVDRADTSKVVRTWQSGPYEKKKFRAGWMPPHPTFFVRRSVYDKYGLLNLDFPLAADYELMLRFLYKREISTAYIPKVLVKMRAGGTSRPGMYTIKSVIENYRAWKVNGLPYPVTVLQKPFAKISQFFHGRSGAHE